MFHVRQSRRQRLPCVHRANARRRSAPEGAGRTRPEAVLLPPDDPLPRGTHRRSLAVRMRGPAAVRSACGEGFLGPHSYESSGRVRGVAWFERGDLRSSRSQEILPAWGAGDSGSNPDGPTFMEGPSTDFREVVSAPVPYAGPRRPGPFPFQRRETPYAPFCSDYVVKALVPHLRLPGRAGTFPVSTIHDLGELRAQRCGGS